MIFCLSRPNDILCDVKQLMQSTTSRAPNIDRRTSSISEPVRYRKLQRFFLADDRECDKCLQVETLSSSRDSIGF